MYVICCVGVVFVSFLFYDLLVCEFVRLFNHKAATHLVQKFEQSHREANHKIKMIRQQHRRLADKLSDKVDIVDISSVPDEDDGKSANNIRAELALLVAKVDTERKR